jgi:tetratricopeptide (TPR) repeat protein
MRMLRLTQSDVDANRYRVEAALEGSGHPRQVATAEFGFALTAQDRENLRWYLEDYLQHTADPAPQIAARIESRIAEIGVELFKAVFQSNDDARDLWATLRDRLNDTRLEIITGVREATTLPWELLRDPKVDTPLALRARSFVRAAHQTAQRPHLPQTAGGPIRVLLVICRPRGSDDVPFRSVASRLIKGLSDSACEAFQLDVLRPPTFERLSKVLRAAKTRGKPYHVLHFDGHGTYAEIAPSGRLIEILSGLSAFVLSAPRTGKHGYLIFENPLHEKNAELVDGPALGKLLVETDVPVLVLNACRSAHAEAPAEPAPAPTDASNAPDGANSDIHAKVRAFGSLAQEVVDAGVAGVVAMRYNIYVVTAAQFVADLYESLAGGQALGEAVTLGRKQLEAQPLRQIAYTPRPLQDWMVPIVYEAAPVVIFPRPAQKADVFTISADRTAPASSGLAPELEKRPDGGFFGRDETLLALDRAFDKQAIVLLHAYAGSGKTSTAAEFARWYHFTGGIKGPVLFTSFEQKTTLSQALNETIGRVFSGALERSGVHWLAMSDEARRDMALQVMAQVPMLWIWDNVEPVAGFPTGSPSVWSAAEQGALADFLRSARGTKAKFLLTSRRDEREWLGDLPAPIKLPPMPMQERVQLARALAEKIGRHLADVEDWMPLLRFTEGNPLTIAVLVGQALRDGLKTKDQVEAFVSRLRDGENVFKDEEREGRDRSLGASLSYGFEHAFREEDLQRLALLHFFQGLVDVDLLCLMGDTKADWCLPEVRGLTREQAVALLDRAAEIGLLAPIVYGCYKVHPAVPWFLKRVFQQHYGNFIPAESKAIAATRAFVQAVSRLAQYYDKQISEGRSQLSAVLSAEEANLLHARQLASAHGWWSAFVGIMQGLFALYSHRGRWAEFRRLVNETVPNVMDPITNEPLPGREDVWEFVMDFLSRLAFEERRWDEGERLQLALLAYSRNQAAGPLECSDASLDGTARKNIHDLVAALNELGMIQVEQRKEDCFASFDESLTLAQRIGDRASEVTNRLNVGVAYLTVRQPADLERAESCFQDGLQLVPETDRLLRSKFLSELGFVARERLERAISAGQPVEVLNRHLRDAIRFYEEGLALTPEDAVASLIVKHQALGSLYDRAGLLDQSLDHSRGAIRLYEMQGDSYGAANVRYNIALYLFHAGRFVDAQDYANAALQVFKDYGEAAMPTFERTQNLLRQIKLALQTQSR